MALWELAALLLPPPDANNSQIVCSPRRDLHLCPSGSSTPTGNLHSSLHESAPISCKPLCCAISTPERVALVGQVVVGQLAYSSSAPTRWQSGAESRTQTRDSSHLFALLLLHCTAIPRDGPGGACGATRETKSITRPARRLEETRSQGCAPPHLPAESPARSTRGGTAWALPCAAPFGEEDHRR